MAKLRWVQMGEHSWTLSATLDQPWSAMVAKDGAGEWAVSVEDTLRRRVFIPAGAPFASASAAKLAAEDLIREQSA